MRQRKTLKQLRAEHQRMSQQALAVAANVSVSTVAKMEAGLHAPRFDVAHRVATALGVGVDDIEWPTVQRKIAA